MVFLKQVTDHDRCLNCCKRCRYSGNDVNKRAQLGDSKAVQFLAVLASRVLLLNRNIDALIGASSLFVNCGGTSQP